MYTPRACMHCTATTVNIQYIIPVVSVSRWCLHSSAHVLCKLISVPLTDFLHISVHDKETTS